jgi:hypothetical protein
MAAAAMEPEDFFNYLFQVDNGILKKYIEDSFNVPIISASGSRIRILEDKMIGPFHFNRHIESSRPNYITFLITGPEVNIVAKIRVELPPAGQSLRVYDDLSNIEISKGAYPNIWHRRINKRWILSEEYDRAEREKKAALMGNIKDLGFVPPSENGSYPGGSQFREMNLERLRYTKPQSAEQVAANLRVGGIPYHEAHLLRKDPLAGLHIPLTPIQKYGGRRRHRTQRRRPKSKSKSYRRRRV